MNYRLLRKEKEKKSHGLLKENKDYEKAILDLETYFEDCPDARALVRFIAETGLRFDEACTLTVEEFFSRRYHSIKLRMVNLELPYMSPEARKMISDLIGDRDGLVFEKKMPEYRTMIQESSILSDIELVAYARNKQFMQGKERSRKMKQGKLFYDEESGRYDFHYTDEDNEKREYGGIHCGEVFEFNLNDVWVPARVEMSFDRKWYLVGLPGLKLDGLEVRKR